MNNQQAINLLKGLEKSLDDYCELNDEGKTAFGMAITALELFGNSEQLPSVQSEKRTEERAETHGVCLDTISRQAIKELMLKYGFTASDMTVTEFVEDILLSAEPNTTTHDSIPAKTGRNDGDGTSSDCISRTQAIDFVGSMNMCDEISNEAYKKLTSYLDELSSVQPEPHWIPCSERLPEEETDVLVTRTFLGCKDGSHGWNNHIPPTTYVEVAQYFNGEWTALSDEYKIARNRHTNPIAWMPLPEPYQGEGEQDG